MTSLPKPVPSGRDLPPPSRWQRVAAQWGGALAGLGFGILIVILFTLLLCLVSNGALIVAFFYGIFIFAIPISITFLLGMMVLGAQRAAKQYDTSGNRFPGLAISGFFTTILVVILIGGLVKYQQVATARKQSTLRNNLRQNYGYLYYPNAFADPDRLEQMRTTDTYQQVTTFYKQFPACEVAKSYSGGGTFLIPCRIPGTVSTLQYVRVRSRVEKNEPYLTIDTTATMQW